MTTEAKDRLDGDGLYAMFAGATGLLEANVEAVNALNVFPVPDGDTGTNMFLTMRSVTGETASLGGAASGEVAAAMAHAALMGARGNSGVILSQVFKGMAVALEGTRDFGANEMAAAYGEARERSYNAVGNPVEGTMLTVIADVAAVAEEAVASGATLQEVCEAVCAAARDSVARTPTLLPVLRDAGVVDAGGFGFAILLEGVASYVRGKRAEALQIEPPEPLGVDGAAGEVSIDFLRDTDGERYGYCTQLLIEGEGLDPYSIRGEMGFLGGSAVVVGDAAAVKVHIHADDPGPVISVAVSHGRLSQVSVANMDEQHAEFAASRRKDSVGVLSVVAVASGAGLRSLLLDLGVSEVIGGGDTMNPSVRQIADAVEKAPSDRVVILPNNRNIVPAALRVAEVTRKSVRVVPTTTIPEGVAALLAFDPGMDLEACALAMEEGSGAVRTGEVTEAVRGVDLNGVAVRPGQLIGLLDLELVAAGDELSGVVESVVRMAGASDGDMVTLYWGEPVTEEVAKKVTEDVAVALPKAEFELVAGGQPHYHFYVSVE